MIYQVSHTTKYEYDLPAAMCHNLVYQKPLVNGHQKLISFSHVINPKPQYIGFHTDFFENEALFFSILKRHQQLTVEVVSQVEVSRPAYLNLDFAQSAPWEEVGTWLSSTEAMNDIRQFYLESKYVRFIAGIREYAKDSFKPGRPILEAAFDLTKRIFTDFKFTSGFTDVSTPLETVFSSRKGVCQDFAHFQLACFRSLGLAAHYVSGYIETIPPKGKPKLIGADASHAWTALYVPTIGWVEFDATNNLVVADQHIRAAVGRDFTDIVPLKGVVYSGGNQKMDVAVDVRRLG